MIRIEKPPHCRKQYGGRYYSYTITFSKSEAGCLQTGQIKSAGSSSPSYSYPQIRQRQIVFPVLLAGAAGFGLILLW